MFNNYFFKFFILSLLVCVFVFIQTPLSTEAHFSWANPLPGKTINTIVVTTTADILDPNDGSCSLREAIISANTNPGGLLVAGECQKGSDTLTDRIHLLSGETYFLTLAGALENDSKTGDLDVLNNSARLDIEIVVSGDTTNRPVIDATGSVDRVFDIREASFSASNISIQNGGGGIHNDSGTVNLLNTEIRNMKAKVGAGILNSSGYLSLTDSYIQDNEAAGSGGGIYNSSAGVMHIVASTIKSNKANQGGGIFNWGEINFENPSQISLNISTGDGGGLHNRGTVTFKSEATVFFSNQALFNGGGLYNAGGVISGSAANFILNHSFLRGGGIANINEGTIDFESIIMQQNEADDAGSGFYNGIDSRVKLKDGLIYNQILNSGIFNKGDLELSDTEIFSNAGGGIVSEGGTILLQRTRIYDNNHSSGGGIHLAAGANATIYQSSIYQNKATLNGGGIYMSRSSLEMANTTVSGNTTDIGLGGGLHLHGDFAGELVRFYNVTVADNSAKDGKGQAVSFIAENLDIEVSNTILTGPQKGVGSGVVMCHGGTVESGGHNLVLDKYCLSSMETGDQRTNPQLGDRSLVDGTMGHMPELDSPAFGNGDSAVCAASPVSGVDQRGLAREYGCEIGAIELLQAPPTVTETPEPGETPVSTPVATATPKPGETPVATATPKPGETPEPGTGEKTYQLFLPLAVKN